jgi:hypothetical protein
MHRITPGVNFSNEAALERCFVSDCVSSRSVSPAGRATAFGNEDFASRTGVHWDADLDGGGIGDRV